jgi:hypothetical protein
LVEGIFRQDAFGVGPAFGTHQDDAAGARLLAAGHEHAAGSVLPVQPGAMRLKVLLHLGQGFDVAERDEEHEKPRYQGQGLKPYHTAC